VDVMSADNWLNITKKGKWYILSGRAGDGDRDFDSEEFETLEEAVKEAKTRMDEEYYEYGLILGDL
jgi:hypothetical protein